MERDDPNMPAIIPTKFWTEYIDDPDEPGKKKGVDWVAWVKKGDRTGAITQERVDRLMPRRKPARTYKDHRGNPQTIAAKDIPGQLEWKVIEDKYNAWKKGQEIPEDGTPLEAWPGCSQAMVAELKKLNIRTLEDFVGAPDHALAGIPIPNLRGVRKTAENFLLAQGEVSATERALSERDARIEALEAKLGEVLRAQAPAQPAPAVSEPKAEPDGEADALAGLREELDKRGVKFDGRWGLERLQQALREALEAA